MPGLFSWKTTKPKSTSNTDVHKNVPLKTEVAQYTYFPIGRGQIRLLRYVRGSESEPDKIRLEIQVFDRRTKPQYSGLSYVCGAQTPRQTISLNGCSFDIGPNLYNALQCARKGLLCFQWFWVDAICIDQKNVSERNDQVRAMAETYSNATAVASWIGLCDELLLPVFSLNVRTQNMHDLNRASQKRLEEAFRRLCKLEYWSRIWIQQELLLNPNVVLFCGEYRQPLHPLMEWQRKQGRALDLLSDTFFNIETGVEWYQWRQAPVLRILTWASSHKSTDVRDKMFALLSLVVEHEREALKPYFPDYGLTVSQVVMVIMTHIRRFSGQRRAAKQVDAVLYCFGDPGDAECSNVVRHQYYELTETSLGADGRRSCRLSTPGRNELQKRTLLHGQLNFLDVCDCVFSQELGPTAGQLVDVRSPRTWQRSHVWVVDPPLAEDLDRYYGVSYSRD